VIEVKTTDAYAIKTATLVGYISALISAQEIPTKQDALGLYVVGRTDADLRQLENAIVAEGRNEELRIITVASLLDLADVMQQYDVSHQDVLTIIKPSGPRVDLIVGLLSRLVGQSSQEEVTTTYDEETEPVAMAIGEGVSEGAGPAAYWISPVKDTDTEPALECVQTLVGKHRIYAYGDRTPGRKSLKPGDWICFYASGIGVVAHAEVASYPEHKPSKLIHDSERYPWTFRVALPGSTDRDRCGLASEARGIQRPRSQGELVVAGARDAEVEPGGLYDSDGTGELGLAAAPCRRRTAGGYGCVRTPGGTRMASLPRETTCPLTSP